MSLFLAEYAWISYSLFRLGSRFTISYHKKKEYLKDSHDFVVCWQLAVSNLRQVLFDIAYFATEPIQSLQLQMDVTLNRIQRNVFYLSQQMFDSDLFWFVCLHTGFDMEKWLNDRTLSANFLLGNVCLCRQINLILVLHVYDNENWSGRVFSENFINVDVLVLELGTCCVPAHEFLLYIDLH